MGKEFRVGLSVVGALLVAFCVLLYARLSRGPSGPPDVLIESDDSRSQITPTHQKLRGRPTIVKRNPSDSFGSSSDPTNLSNPRDEQHSHELENQEWHERERRFLPIAPAAVDDDFISTQREPDAVPPAPTTSVTVQQGENIEALARRLYGSPKYERALWQWLFDRGLDADVQPSAQLDVPTLTTLRRTYPQLVPVQ